MSTLRKSYSLSDLSEPDLQRSHDEVDEMLYGQARQMIQYRRVHPNQRYMRTNVQNQNMNGINRSSSTSRTVDVYYDEMMSRSSDNYE